MAKRNIRIIKEYTEKHKKRSTRQRILIGIAALVVFCTTYAMILPAITMEGKLKCQKEEHIHQSACYGSEKTLNCQQKEGEIHLHQENCYTSSGELICKLNTTSVHTHTEECYTSKMIMTCKKIPHQHYQECFSEVVAEKEEVTAVPSEKPTEFLTEAASEVIATEITTEAKVKEEVKSVGYTDLKTYLETLPNPEHRGTIFHEVYIEDKLVEDLSVVTGEGFIVKISINAPGGILPGKYKYTLPENFHLSSDAVHSGSVVSNDFDKKNVGTYSAEEGSSVVILLEFNSDMENFQDFTGYLEFDIDISNGGEDPQPARIAKSGIFENEDGTVDAFSDVDGMFHFKIDALVPAHRGAKPLKTWHIQDYSRILKGVAQKAYWEQDLTGETINISYTKDDGTVVNKSVPEISTVEDDSIDIAYKYNIDENSLYLLNKCRCISANCNHWNDDDSACHSLEEIFGDEIMNEIIDESTGESTFVIKPEYVGWCTCWNLTQNATLTIEYKNNQLPDSRYILNEYPGHTYENTVSLIGDTGDEYSDDNVEINATTADDIPELIDKALSVKFNNKNHYRGKYKITVNKSKVDLSQIDSDNDGNADDKILIQDTMKNAAYVPGSMVINAVGLDNVSQILKYGDDYEIEYIPGSSKASEVYNATMNIYLKKLGPYTYNIEYNAQAISTSEEGKKAPLDVSNTVTTSIYSFPSNTNSYSSSFVQGWSYLRRYLTLRKIEKITLPEPTDPSAPTQPIEVKLLPGATYGLYTVDGYEIARGTTDENGLFTFATNVRLGIIFNEDTPYYVKEISPPEGYNLDSKQHWFCFLGSTLNEEYYEEAYKVDLDGIMFCSLENEGESNIMTLEDEKTIFLPETGGCGKFIYIATGLLFIFCGAYGLYKKFLFGRRVY